MKKIATFILATLAIANVWAQADNLKDLIYTADSKVVEAKVLEVSSGEVKYKDWNNQMGPTFILTASEVQKVEFSNGTVKTFAGAAAKPAASAQSEQAAASKSSKSAAAAQKPAVGFQFNLDVEGNLAFVSGSRINYAGIQSIDRDFAVGGVNVVLGAGVRVAQWMYVGVAAGVLGEWGNPKVKYNGNDTKGNYSAYTLPIYGDFRAYAPTHGNCYPYAEVGVGGYVGLAGEVKVDGTKIDELCGTPEGGFYFLSGVGLEFKCLNIGAGYKLMRNNNFTGNHGYVKLGISLGRPQKLRK